jgi:hypothetical protein
VTVTQSSIGASVSTLHHRQTRQQRLLHRWEGCRVFFHNHPRQARSRIGRAELRKARIWVGVLRRELAETRAALEPRRVLAAVDWRARQIAAAEVIGRESTGDPWPNCPDPFDGGGSWDDTVQCENGGSWLDTPGFYRCGLQFDPMWERRFGRLCPA